MFRVATVFGIRPDFIRASVILKKLIKHPKIDLQFIYTGQHYDEELKGVFFRELNLPEPQFVLDATGKNHVEQHAKLISQLGEALEMIKPDVCLFLGDANAVVGCIAPLKMGIPIAHIEAGMRSHDWSMPEEKNRVIIDRVSDVLYAYQHDYKVRLIQEGINPNKVVVTGNTICDVIKEFAPQIDAALVPTLEKFGIGSKTEKELRFGHYGTAHNGGYAFDVDVIKPAKQYGVMTLHRNDVVTNKKLAFHILNSVSRWAAKKNMKIILPMMPRLRALGWKDNHDSFIITKPLGMFEWMALEKNASIEFTDSGTNQETSSIFGTPCVVTRRCTERPETFDSGITTMELNEIGKAADSVFGKKVKSGYTLKVEGRSPAKVIVRDLVKRLENKFEHWEDLNPFSIRHMIPDKRLKYIGSWV